MIRSIRYTLVWGIAGAVSLTLWGAEVDLRGVCRSGLAAAKTAGCATESGCCATENACCAGDPAPGVTTAEYKVTGMTDAACADKLVKALAQVAGVTEPLACAKSGLAKVAYDPTKAKKEQLLAAIQGAGFKVAGEVVELKVDGMSCGACSDKVSQALTSLKGVKEQKVSSETKLAVVTFDPQKLAREDIVAAIDKTGFKVAP